MYVIHDSNTSKQNLLLLLPVYHGKTTATGFLPVTTNSTYSGVRILEITQIRCSSLLPVWFKEGHLMVTIPGEINKHTFDHSQRIIHMKEWPLTSHVFMATCLIKHSNNITFISKKLRSILIFTYQQRSKLVTIILNQ
jgi:hypothetical protein